ncbi:uncharacterized protein LOC120431845 [Culex pipiens pallens]|uniref:uncharacterized protein LOC120431845 n=1 Tax=Culex pipiens pallens TaxID=42434 RepID=UPI00195448AC|nr:uncharacterized protein LOC120431845 [Culex pipiens pallens]
MYFSNVLIIFGTVISLAKGEYVVEFTDYGGDCENGKPMPNVDFSDLETVEDDEGNGFLTGKIVFKSEYNDPIELKVYTERQKQGAWTAGEISRDVLNMCPLLTAPSEPWHLFTSAMKHQECPFPANHEETFDMLPLGDINMQFPDTFAGNWRLFAEVTTPREGVKVTECMRVGFLIKET